jgi:hypothetical protein
MSITAILLALLLSGFGNPHANGAYGGGPVGAPATTSGIGGLTADDVSGGGPVL